MPRNPNLPVQVPGAAAQTSAPAAAAGAESQTGPAAGSAASDPPQSTAGGQPSMAEVLSSIQAMQAALLQRDEQIAQLTAQLQAQGSTEPAAADAAALIVPVTKHGARALATSEFATMTSAEVAEKLHAGEITLSGRAGVLCSDGYFCDPGERN